MNSRFKDAKEYLEKHGFRQTGVNGSTHVIFSDGEIELRVGSSPSTNRVIQLIKGDIKRAKRKKNEYEHKREHK